MKFVIYPIVTASLLMSPVTARQTRKLMVRLAVDGSEAFSFDSVGVAVEYKAQGTKHSETSVYATPDRSGVVLFDIPISNQATVYVQTYDPTIILATNPQLEGYSLEKGQPRLIGNQVIDLSQESSAPAVIQISLRRTAALVICAPPDIDKGALVLRRPWWKDESIAYSFENRRVIEGEILGGLEPGEWVINYVDDKDQERYRSNISLQKGTISNLPCSKRDN
ncbi:MAG TPA: hypothetical protein VEZ90_08590 [Blastocatellia bacterium]|nr:hypothetical protein [Blastocatellia bacterium]